ncbi:MAG: ABC transporter permease subunit [Clostridia bacterium]|nr:ABC transporter permease subunit [Clostridia bacterium]
MTLFIHELNRSKFSLLVWTLAISFMLAVTVIIYPQMSEQVDSINEAFSRMGDFSTAFGMDKLNFGELTDYFCVECSNTLGLGGALFAAIYGALALAGEEKDKTGEFLFTQPVSRGGIVISKLTALAARIFILNAVVAAVCFLSIFAIGEKADFKVIALVFAAHLILSLEFGAISFGISAFASGASVGASIGVVFGFYFLNIVANITDKAKFLKFVTPYAYTDGASIRADGALDWVKIAIGVGISALCIAAAYIRYRRKDL